MSSSSAGMSFSAMSARTGWSKESSKAAVTWPCSAPWRTSVTSPRAPSARAKASSRMDLPAPVSPVSTDRPDAKSMSSRSMRTISRIESRASMTTVLAFRLAADAEVLPDTPLQPAPKRAADHAFEAMNAYRSGTRARPERRAASAASWVEATCSVKPGHDDVGKRFRRDDLEFARGQFRECLADPVAFVLVRLNAPRLHQGIGVLVPAAFGEVVAEHRGRSLRLLHDTERHIDLGEPQQGFLDVARPLVARHHHLEAIDGAYVVVRVLQLTPNIHFLARQPVARDLDLALGGDGIFGTGIFADDLFEGLDRVLRPILIAQDF